MRVTKPNTSGSAFDELMGEFCSPTGTCGYEMSENGVLMGIPQEQENEVEQTSP